jgi:hypothetical protein
VIVSEGSSGGYGFASPEILPKAVTVPATVSHGFWLDGSSLARPEDAGGLILFPPLLEGVTFTHHTWAPSIFLFLFVFLFPSRGGFALLLL